MSAIRELGEQVANLFTSRAKRFSHASLTLKILMAVGSFVSGSSQLFSGSALTPANYLVFGSSFVVFLASLLSMFTEADSSKELDTARRALVSAEDAERDAEISMRNIDKLEVEQARAIELYYAMNAMSVGIEQYMSNPPAGQDVVATVQTIMGLGKRSLIIAMGAQMAEHFTLCVYRAELDDKTQVLRCIADARSVECDIGLARLWPLGVGVGGAVLARKTEIVVPDLSAVEIGSLYSAPQKKPYDEERYRSVAGVPIILDPGSEPWGVVIGTSNRPKHFYIPRNEPGLQTVEAVRSLAAAMALTVRAHEIVERSGK